MTSINFYQNQLDRFLTKWSLACEFYSATDDTRYPIKIHVGRFTTTDELGDINQRMRRGIISTTDLINANVITLPKDGDKIYYLDQTTTIDAVDERIEVGAIIGYDLILRGT